MSDRRDPRHNFALGARGEHIEERLTEQRQHHLGFRIAETGVELEHAQSIRGEHQTRVEATDKWIPPLAECLDAGFQHVTRDILKKVLRAGIRRRGDRAHPAGVGAAVAVKDALVVSCGDEQTHAASIAQPEHAHLGTREQFLDNDLTSRGAETLIAETILQRAFRLLDGAADRDTLAQRQPVGFDDARPAELGDKGTEASAIGDVAVNPPGGRDACRVHHLLRERLRRLDARSSGSRTEDEDASRVAGIGHACGGGCVGADDHQIHRALGGEPGD